MKFIVTLIVTAVAVKDDEMQFDGELDLILPTLSDAAAALADVQVADANTIASIGKLDPEEALNLALWCTINENACASNFEDVVWE